jgi:hypothetical protein
MLKDSLSDPDGQGSFEEPRRGREYAENRTAFNCVPHFVSREARFRRESFRSPARFDFFCALGSIMEERIPTWPKQRKQFSKQFSTRKGPLDQIHHQI